MARMPLHVHVAGRQKQRAGCVVTVLDVSDDRHPGPADGGLRVRVVQQAAGDAPPAAARIDINGDYQPAS